MRRLLGMRSREHRYVSQTAPEPCKGDDQKRTSTPSHDHSGESGAGLPAGIIPNTQYQRERKRVPPYRAPILTGEKLEEVEREAADKTEGGLRPPGDSTTGNVRNKNQGGVMISLLMQS